MKTLWRFMASGLLALGGALVGFLLASQRRPSSQREHQARTEEDERIAEIKASMTARKQAVVTEQEKQRDLAQQTARVDEQLAQVEARVRGLSHDDLDAEIHRALAGAPSPSAAPGVIKPNRVIKPAN